MSAYLVVGGLPGAGAGSRLFHWTGTPSDKPEPVPGVDLTALNPKALYLRGRSAVILSDDGRRAIGGQERDCAAPGVDKTFRGLNVTLDGR